MSSLKKALSFLTVAAITALCFKMVSLPSVSAAATNFACMSAMLLMPEGATDIVSAKYETSGENLESPIVTEDEEIPKEANTPENVDSPGTVSSGNDSAIETSASVDNMVGSIIDKLFSPNSANTSYNNIFINNKTGVDIDIASELAAGFNLKLNEADSPQVLIYHTHTTESYMMEDRDYYTDTDQARSTDLTQSVVAVGNVLAQKIEDAGFKVIHDTTVHDYPEYNGSYTRSAETINKYLKENPSVKIIIDLHRDSISSGDKDKVAPTIEINGKKAAQVMLVMGSETGSIKNYPNWKENLHLAMRLQQTMEVMYPSLARSMQLSSGKFNQNLSSGAMLIEIGTEANTLEEAMYSGELVGTALGSLFNTLK